MKIKSICLAFLSVISFNCNQSKEQKTPEIDYKFTTQDVRIGNCSDKDIKLFNEALLSFEEDIKTKYNVNDQNINRAYIGFLNDTRINRINLKPMVSQQTKTVFEALKTRTDLWNENQLNYDSELVKCLVNNISDKNLKTTFNALLSTNSMSFRMYGEAVRSKSTTLRTDKYLALFIALDQYYAKLHNIDLSKVEEAKSKVDFNKKPVTKSEENKKTSHSGHNHR